MNVRLAFAGLALLAALLAAWLLSGDQQAPTAVGSLAAEEREPPPSAAQSTPEAVVAPAPEPERSTVAPASGPVPPDGPRATLSGRCVDEGGTPISGVRVTLHGWQGNSLRLQRYRLEHGEVQWEDPADVVTAADGRFAFTFVPPAPYQFTCDMTVDGRVPMRFRWSELPAETRDLGDVVLPRGVEVRGRVVDEDGIGVAGIDVMARPELAQIPDDAVFPQSYVRTTADAGGFFRFAALSVGRATFELAQRHVVEPRGPVTLSPPSQEVRIVTAEPAEPVEDTRPAIRGVVVDVAGPPVPRARVEVGEPSGPAPAAFRRSVGTSTDREGRFVLRAKANGLQDPQPIHVEAEGYEPWRSPEPVPFGTDDLRVRLVPGPPLAVRVTRAPDGEPVERYGISLAPVRERGGLSSMDADILYVGDHPGGVLEVPRVTPRRYRLMVHVAESVGLSQPEPRTIDVQSGVPLAVDVELTPLVFQEIELVDAAGEPVVGVKVELLAHTAGGEVALTMYAMEPDVARMNSPEHVAELVAEAMTDSAGRVRLRGALGRSVALRVPGPGNVPKLVQPVRLGEEPLRVVVERGAVLEGRVEPVGVLAQLRAEGGAAGQRSEAPKIVLERATGEPREFPLPGLFGRGALHVEGDGTFEVEGIPPGTWDVTLRWPRVSSMPPFGTTRSQQTHRLPEPVTLADGEERAIVIDIEELRRHEVRFEVLVNGNPVAATLDLRGRVADAERVGQAHEDRFVTPVPDGRATLGLAAGEWTVVPIVTFGLGVQVPCASTTFHVPLAGDAGVRLDLRLGQRPVRILLPDGKPAAGLRIGPPSVPRPDGPGIAAAPTDEDGRTVVHGPAGTVPIEVVKQSLQGPQATFAWMRATEGGGSTDGLFVTLPPIELSPGATETVELRLPEEWSEPPGK